MSTIWSLSYTECEKVELIETRPDMADICANRGEGRWKGQTSSLKNKQTKLINSGDTLDKWWLQLILVYFVFENCREVVCELIMALHSLI